MTIRGVMTGGNAGVTTNQTDAIMAMPSGGNAPQLGDTAIIISLHATGTATLTAPTGYTLISNSGSGPDYASGGVLACAVYAKLLAVSGDLTQAPDVHWSGATARNVAAGIVMQGDILTGFHLPAAVKQTTGASITSASVTGLTTGGDLLYLLGVRSTTAHVVATLPSGWTNDVSAATGNAASPFLNAIIGHLTAGAGTSGGGQSVSLSNTPTTSVIYTLALPPAPPAKVWHKKKSGVFVALDMTIIGT